MERERERDRESFRVDGDVGSLRSRVGGRVGGMVVGW